MRRAGGFFSLFLSVTLVASGLVFSPMAASAAPAAPTVGPASPVIVGASARGNGIMVSWTPADASTPVLSYAITAAPVAAPGITIPGECTSVTATAPGTDSAALVRPLCVGIPYVATMTATDTSGTSAPSDRSHVAVPLPARAPDAPVIVSTRARNASAIVSWVAPDDDGGSTISNYRIVATSGTLSKTMDVNGAQRTATLTGLKNKKPYAITLVATNAIGTSIASKGSVTPSTGTKATAPQGLTALPGSDGTLNVSWHAPADDGGKPVTKYNVTATPVVEQVNGAGDTTWVPEKKAKVVKASTTALNVTLTKLDVAKQYQVVAVAHTGAGDGTVTTPVGPLTPKLRMQPNAVQLSAQSLASMRSSVNGVLTFVSPPAQITSLTTDNVLVATVSPQTPRGLLAKVTSISQPTAGTYVVTTTQASLGDAFADADVAAGLDPSSAANGTFSARAPGIRNLQRANPALSIDLPTLTIGLSVDEGEKLGLSLSGTASVTPSFYVDASVHLFPPKASVSVGASVDVHASISLTAFRKVSHKWQVGYQVGVPFTIGPFVLVPVYPVYLEVSETGAVGASFGGGVTLGASADWTTSHADKLSLHNNSSTPTLDEEPLVKPENSITGQASVSLDPELLLYGVAGAGLTLTAGFRGVLDLAAPSGAPWFTLSMFLSLGAQIDLDFKLIHPKLSYTLAEISFALFHLSGPPPSTLEVHPDNPDVVAGTTQQFTATEKGEQIFPTWSISGGTRFDSITPGGLLTVSNPPYRTLVVTAKNAKGNTYDVLVNVTDTSGFSSLDPPGVLVAVRDTDNDPTRAKVTWTAPNYTGGSPVAHYTITTRPATRVTTVDGGSTSTTITGLDASTAYLVLATATTFAGETTPAAQSYLVSPVPNPWSVQDVVGTQSTALAVKSAAVETNGDFIIVGHGLAQPATPGRSTFIQRVTPIGSVIWVRELGGLQTGDVTDPWDVAVNAAGDIYVVGETNGPLTAGETSPSPKAAFVAKYSSAGALEWSQVFTAGDASTQGQYVLSTASSVAADPAGGIVVGGINFVAPTPSGLRTLSGFTWRFDPAGEVTWQAPSPGASVDDVKIDPQGNTYVVGEVDQPDSYAPAAHYLARFDSSGHRALYLTEQGSLSDAGPGLARVAVGSDGSMFISLPIYTQLGDGPYVPTGSLIVKFDSDGHRLFRSNSFLGGVNLGAARDLIADDDGGVDAPVDILLTSFLNASLMHVDKDGNASGPPVILQPTGAPPFEFYSGISVLRSGGTLYLLGTHETQAPASQSIFIAHLR